MSSWTRLTGRLGSMFRIERIKPTWLEFDAARNQLSIDSKNNDRLSGRKGLFPFGVSLTSRMSDPAYLGRED